MDLGNVTNTLRLREYYYMLLRHKLVFLWIVVLSMVVAFGVSVWLPKIYRAETVLLVKEEKILNPLIRGLAVSPSFGARVRTLREELLSWQRLTLLVEKLKLDKEAKTPRAYERLIQSLRSKIHIKFKGSAIIRVAFEGRNPKQAQDIVQTLADIIVEGTLTSQDLEANSAIRFIKDRLEEYRISLEDSEQRLRQYKEVYNRTLPVATRMNEQIVALKIEINNLLVENTEAHPKVIQTRKLIEQLEGQRDSFMTLASKEGLLDTGDEEYARLVSSVPLQEQQLVKLQRDYSVNAGIYGSLLSKLETAKISQTLEQSEQGTKFQVLEPARFPLKPVKPNQGMILMVGFIIGVGLGIVTIYLIEFNDESLRNLEQAQSFLELPIFGAIGTIRPEELVAGRSIRGGVKVGV